MKKKKTKPTLLHILGLALGRFLRAKLEACTTQQTTIPTQLITRPGPAKAAPQPYSEPTGPAAWATLAG